MTLPLIEPVRLAQDLGPPERLLLVIDFDGTLAPIVDRPDAATLAPGAREALGQLSARTTVAVLSGRPVDELRQRVPDVPMILAGGHGSQILTPEGEVIDLIDIETVSRTLDATQTSLEQLLEDGTGWFVERKSSSLAVHHRLVPPDQEEDRLPRVRALMELRNDEDPGFEVMSGKAVLELRPRSVDKGRALDHIADRCAHLTPLVLGDDVTDEDAFRAATVRGGHAILVSADDRPSSAHWRLADPAAVVTFLARLATDGAVH